MNKATSFIDKKGGRGWTRHEEGWWGGGGGSGGHTIGKWH